MSLIVHFVKKQSEQSIALIGTRDLECFIPGRVMLAACKSGLTELGQVSAAMN